MAADTTQKTIQKVVEEGLEARNLLNFISDGSLADGTSKKPPLSPRPQSVSPKPPLLDLNKTTDTSLLLRSTKRRGTLSRPKSRLRSASAGRNPEKDLRVRYWTFLFENLHRAVDEIYQTCEMDESIVESKEAIMMLENYSKDFHALIQYININKNYEKTAPPNRPTSLAWEVRKSSPGKSLLKNVFIDKLTAGNSSAKRILCFDASSDFSSTSEVKNLTQASTVSCNTNGEPDDAKGRMDIVLETPTIVDPLSKSSCDVTISVVSEPPDEVFPCNENLIVNKVFTLESNPNNTSNITGKENINTPNEVSKGQINEESAKKSTHPSCPEINPPSKASIVSDEISCKENNPPNIIPTETPMLKSLPEKSQNSINIHSDAKNCELNNTKNTEPSANKAAVTTSPNLLKDNGTNPKPKVLTNKSLKKASGVSSVSKNISAEPSVKSPCVRECSSKVDNTNKNIAIKAATSSLKPDKMENSRSLQKPTNAPISKRSLNRNVTPKNEKLDTTTSERKIMKANRNESAIKRNISYVQSLSSKNQSGRFEERVKRPNSRLLSDGHK